MSNNLSPDENPNLTCEDWEHSMANAIESLCNIFYLLETNGDRSDNLQRYVKLAETPLGILRALIHKRPSATGGHPPQANRPDS
jgi:hypothetical protein